MRDLGFLWGRCGRREWNSLLYLKGKSGSCPRDLEIKVKK